MSFLGTLVSCRVHKKNNSSVNSVGMFLQPVEQAQTKKNNKLCNVTYGKQRNKRQDHAEWSRLDDVSMSTSPRQAEEMKRTAHAALSALNMQPAQSSPHYGDVKCNNTAIMHIWYLKSPCLMVIFVLNWIYYKMCSDMKHVAAGPLRRQCKEGKKKKKASDGEISRISE